MTSGDKLTVWFFALLLVGILGNALVEYQSKKLQLEELKIQKECVCKSEE